MPIGHGSRAARTIGGKARPASLIKDNEIDMLGRSLANVWTKLGLGISEAFDRRPLIIFESIK
jgi:hypothetical protein